MNQTDSFHQPVMADEALGYLITRRDGIYIDATAGGGGFTSRIVSRLDPTGRIFAIDRDIEAVKTTRRRFEDYSSQVKVIREDFGNLEELANKAQITLVDGIIFDLGVSSHQLDCVDRGFSYRETGPLDMRMNRESAITAAEIINQYSAAQLAEIIFKYGEERNSRRIAAAIVNSRQKKELTTTFELAAVVRSVTNPRYVNKTLSRVFQGIRIFLNDEIVQLHQGLKAALDLLCQSGRLVVISYHSIEDRIVKNVFREQAKNPHQAPDEKNDKAKISAIRILTKKPITPSPREIKSNPRARSAKMRVAERL
jgi:16S rRNA (cytosine1402-N4)-methyltransferase